MLRSMRVRMTVSLVVLLTAFGWLLTMGLAHQAQALQRFDLPAQQQHIRLVLSTFMVVLFPVVAFGAWMIVDRTLRPLRSLSKQAEASSGRLVSPSSDQEMTELVGTINHLLDRIQASAEAKSRFYAAASHELRTPLQALNGHIETALSKERPAEQYRGALVEAQKQTQRLTRLTRDILLLHQLQAQMPGLGEKANISESIQVSLRELEPLIEARNLSLTLDVCPTLTIAGKQSYADICIRNLLENAVRYCSVGGSVSISLRTGKFEIHNTCNLENSVDLETFFEPFASAGGGNGLGLAVCRAAAEVNGWAVHLSQFGNQVVASVAF